MRRFTNSPVVHFDQSSFYSNFTEDLRLCKRELLIESAFLTVKRVNRLLPVLTLLVQKGTRVTVNTRHPNEHDGIMQTQAIASILAMQSAGITVLYTTGLHRKLAIIDRSIVWEGSLNILSQYDSCELMRRSASTNEARDVLAYTGLERFL